MQSTAGTPLVLETQALMTRHIRKWDQILSGYFNVDDTNEYQDQILFVAWMIEELESVDEYGTLIRVHYSCVQGHEWVRDTLRAFMQLQVGSAHKDLADVMKTFTRPEVVREDVADRCHFCERLYSEVSERSTLAEQPGDIIVIKLMDFSVSSVLKLFYLASNQLL
jgi:hypothetical protein